MKMTLMIIAVLLIGLQAGIYWILLQWMINMATAPVLTLGSILLYFLGRWTLLVEMWFNKLWKNLNQ